MAKVDPHVVIDDAAAVAHGVADRPKAFYKSKRFWISLASASLHYAGYIPGPAAAIVPVVANIAMPILDGLLKDR